MIFSILLPTRNGGKYLKNCILSVLEQNYDDYELIISDNANDDETQEIINSFLPNNKLIYLRQDTVLSVSDNWTKTLQKSNGDYILMLGDDDFLLNGTLEILHSKLINFNFPDCVLFNGFSFVHPKSMSNTSNSYFTNKHFNFNNNFVTNTFLADIQKEHIVEEMFNFRSLIPLNMQTTLFSRNSIALSNNFKFTEPFPDHYLLNSLLINDNKWLYISDNLVIVGVSPKSFGHYYYSQNSTEGLEYLGISTNFTNCLPGSPLINGMYKWLMLLKSNYPIKLKNVNINYNEYAARQFYFWLVQFKYKSINFYQLKRYLSLLTFINYLYIFTYIFNFRYLKKILAFISLNKVKSKEVDLWDSLILLNDINNIYDFSNWLKINKLNDKEKLDQLTIGYVPISTNFTAPGDCRRFVQYAKEKKLNIEIANPQNTYDLVVLSQLADISIWVNYKKGMIVYDLIDSYLSIPKYNIKQIFRGTFFYLNGRHKKFNFSNRNNIIKMCKVANAVICSTDVQKNSILKYNKNTHIILDYHDEIINHHKYVYEIKDTLNLVWEGLPSNIFQLFTIKKALKSISKDNKLCLNVITDLKIKTPFNLFGLIDTKTILNFLNLNYILYPWDKNTLSEIITSSDIAIIPLDLSNNFIKGKPENKLLLFWKMGMPVITSSTDAYKNAMNKAGLNDFTCLNNKEWVIKIKNLRKYIDLRKNNAQNGQIYAQNNFSNPIHTSKWDNLFKSIGFEI